MIDPAFLAAAFRASCLFENQPSAADQGLQPIATPMTPTYPQINSYHQIPPPNPTSPPGHPKPQTTIDSPPTTNTAASVVLSSLMATNNASSNSNGMYIDPLQQHMSSLSDMLRQNVGTHMSPTAPATLSSSACGNMTPKLAAVMPPFGITSDANSTTTRHPRFYKTKICPYLQQKGKCSKGYKCVYAHSLVELRGLPNLEKTKLCPAYKSEGTCITPRCPFAHTIEELRHTDNFYKTKLCHMWKKGKCSAATLCRHAHGPEELNWFRAVARQTSQGGSPPAGLSMCPSNLMQGSDAGSTLNADKVLSGAGFDQQTHLVPHMINPLLQIIQQLQNEQKHGATYPLLCHLQQQVAATSAESQLLHLLRAAQQHDPALTAVSSSVEQQQMEATQAAIALLNLSGLYQQVAMNIPADGFAGHATLQPPNPANGIESPSAVLPATRTPPAKPSMAPAMDENTGRLAARSGPLPSRVQNEGEEMPSSNVAQWARLPIEVSAKVSNAMSSTTDDTTASIPGSPTEHNDAAPSYTAANNIKPNAKSVGGVSGCDDSGTAGIAFTASAAAPSSQSWQQQTLERQPHQVLPGAARCLQVTQLIKALQDQLPLLLQYNPYADPNSLAALLAVQQHQQHSAAESDVHGRAVESGNPFPTTAAAATSLQMELQQHQEEQQLHNRSVL